MSPSPALPVDLGPVFRTRTALAQGVPDRWLRSGGLWTPTRGVRAYERPSCLVDRLRAFAVAAPGDFAFSHVTAALLLGIPLPIEVEADARVHVMTRTPRNRERRRAVVGHRGLESRRVVHVEDLPVVAPADTWVDLGELVGAGKPLGLDDIIVAGDVAARLAGSTCELARAVTRRVRPRGKVTLTFALQFVRTRSASPMETRARLMVVRAGLPEPQLNVSMFGSSGLWRGFGDLVWKKRRVAGEYQGVEFHSSDEDRAADEIRFAGLRNDGWTVVELESDHVFTPEGRQEKLGELAHHLGLDPAALDLAAAEPQFFAPPQFERPRRRRAR